MAIIESTIAPSSAAYKANRDGMLALGAVLAVFQKKLGKAANSE